MPAAALLVTASMWMWMETALAQGMSLHRCAAGAAAAGAAAGGGPQHHGAADPRPGGQRCDGTSVGLNSDFEPFFLPQPALTLVLPE